MRAQWVWALVASLVCMAGATCVPRTEGEGCLTDAECPDGTVCNVLGACSAPHSAGAAWLEAARVRIVATASSASDRVAVDVVAEAPGNVPPGAALEVCARVDQTRSGEERCVRTAFANGTRQLVVSGLSGGTTHRLAPVVAWQGQRREFEPVLAQTRPDAVPWVRASDGASPEYVSLEWAPVEGAERYRVMRDGVIVATTAGRSYVDLGAAPGGVPGPVQRLTATPGTRADAVELAWHPAVAEPGASHRYAVVAENASGEAVPSVPDAGFRAGPPVLEYVVVATPRTPLALGDATSFVDTDAPAGRLEFGALALSRGDVVATLRAELALVDRAPGAEVTYRVVARNAAGYGPAREATGHRAPPAYSIAWELEAGGNEDNVWISIPGAERAVDIALAPGSVRRVRATVVSESGVLVHSARGWAGACDDDGACEAGMGCRNGFCVPDGYVLVPAHAHRLGSTQPAEYGREASEAAFVAVFEHARIFGATEVTQAQWREVMGSSPSYFAQCGGDCPVENISWGSALAYCNALSVRDGLAPCYDLSQCTGDAAAGTLLCERDPVVLAPDGNVHACEGWRLPTGYEWEWAARGPMDTWDESWLPTPEAPDCRPSLSVEHQAFAHTCASPPQGYPGVVCGSDRICRGTIPVASLQPSPWGLFDVAGNVWEWTWGRQAPVPAADSVVVEPLTIANTNGNVGRRGAAWNWRPYHARLGKLSWIEPAYRGNDTGFRVVRTVR